MKVQIDIESELWGRFRSKVINDEGKTLAEVVPGVVEPAIRAYLEPPMLAVCDIADSAHQIVDRITSHSVVPPTPMSIRRCELCDNPTERLYAHDDKKVCYSCWKAAITAIPVPTPPSPPEAA